MPVGSGGGGGGFTPISCVLSRSAIDVHAVGTIDIKWNSLVNNIWDFTPLGAIPAGLGLTFLFDGSDGTITTTTAGVWAFTLAVGLPSADATLAGFTSDPFAGRGNSFRPPIAADGGHVAVALTDKLPSGAGGGSFTFDTTAAATANPYNASATLSIVRLA